jgi:methylglutaconyl-CoA hydratase
MSEEPRSLESARYTRLEAQVTGGVGAIWLCRPEVRNAFDDILIGELADAIAVAACDSAVRTLVIGGRGTAFCAGADLAWMRRTADLTAEKNGADALKLAQMLRALYTCPKPTIARVQGDCFAGGVGLVSACDIAVAADSAVFCLSEVRIGLIPATIGPYVIRAIGARAASRYMLTGERFDALAAARISLVHSVVPAAELDAEVQRFAQALAAGGPSALEATKRLIDDLASPAIDEAVMRDTASRIATLRASPEGRAGVDALLRKARPPWSAPRSG